MRVEPIESKEMIRDIMEYFKATNERDFVMFCIGIYTGLRISDILRLRVNDVYCKNNISIKIKKTGQWINIPINPQLKGIIKNYCKDMPGHWYLIKSRQGHNKPISTTQAYKILKKMSEWFNIQSVGTHTMRKTAGLHMYRQSKNNIGTVMRILGHTDPSITLRYIGVTTEDVRKTMRNLRY